MELVAIARPAESVLPAEAACSHNRHSACYEQRSSRSALGVREGVSAEDRRAVGGGRRLRSFVKFSSSSRARARALCRRPLFQSRSSEPGGAAVRWRIRTLPPRPPPCRPSVVGGGGNSEARQQIEELPDENREQHTKSASPGQQGAKPAVRAADAERSRASGSEDRADGPARRTRGVAAGARR